jgi:4-diphosphocytidyl-2-C-methyl-D-erythritol kinase
MVCFPNAKINIGLNITNKRKDGFHDIETVFYPINLCDILEFIENGTNSVNFTNSGIIVDSPPENNLIIKAYNLIKEKYKIPGLDIHLHKKIPYGAGLGGGSSNAAFMLKMLNENFELKISENELIEISRKIGSDCAFFIKNKAVFASEKGDVFTEININLKEKYIYLIKPENGVGTKDAYSKVIPQKSKTELKIDILKNIESWKETIKNDFEKSVFDILPEIKEIKEILYKNGAIYSSMSGSGSSVYGIFSEKPKEIKEFENYFSFKEKL